MSKEAELEKLLCELYCKLLERNLLPNPFLSNPQAETPTPANTMVLGPGVGATRLTNGEILVYNPDDDSYPISLNKEQIKQLLALSLNIPTPPATVWTTTLSPLLQCHGDANNKVVFTNGESTHYPTHPRVADLAANLMWLL